MMLKTCFQPGIVEAGCDEAGRGCLAGPVFAAAVVLPETFTLPFLNDSKQLTAARRNTLRTIIEEEAMAFSVQSVDAPTIDRINILKASILAMHLALDQLRIRMPIQHIIVDGNRFTPYFGLPHRCIVQGDAQYASIAAASILAKTYRDDFMEKIHQEFPQYGWNENKGYPTPKHKAALRAFGLSPYHRISYKWT